jgi:hypothetical protein
LFWPPWMHAMVRVTKKMQMIAEVSLFFMIETPFLNN